MLVSSGTFSPEPYGVGIGFMGFRVSGLGVLRIMLSWCVLLL